MAKRVKVNADQFVKNWESGMQGASAKIEQGVNAVTESPGLAAAAQADVWAQNTLASKDRYKTNVGKVRLEDWKQATITKGIPAIQNALSMAKPKVASAAAILIPAINTALGTLKPRSTNWKDNLIRVAQMAEGVRNAFRK